MALKNCGENEDEYARFPLSRLDKAAETTKLAMEDAWKYLGLDSHLAAPAIKLRMQIRNSCKQLKLVELTLNLFEKGVFDRKIIDACKAFGPAGMQIKGYGCAGLTLTESAMYVMELARVDASLATFVVVHSGLAMRSIEVAGSEEQKQYWLPRMSAWESIGCFGLTEASHGSDASHLKTKAQRVAGGWILNGEKRWIGNGTFAHVAVIWARREDTGTVSAFLVEPRFKGFKSSVIKRKGALRIVQNAILKFENCFVPDSHKMPVEGFKGATGQVLDTSRLLVVAACTGLLLGAFESTLRYTLGRKQFSRPVASFQLIQEKLVRTLGFVQACGLMTLHTAYLLDCIAAPDSTDAHPNIQNRGTFPLMGTVALAKASCSKMSREGVSLCRECLGGNGIIWDFRVAKAFADMEALYTYEGTYEINVLIAGRALTGINAISGA